MQQARAGHLCRPYPTNKRMADADEQKSGQSVRQRQGRTRLPGAAKAGCAGPYIKTSAGALFGWPPSPAKWELRWRWPPYPAQLRLPSGSHSPLRDEHFTSVALYSGKPMVQPHVSNVPKRY